MKLLSVAVPCYNASAYMEKCINTLLTGGDEMEIIVVDDGSTKDNTGEIADKFGEKYPNIVKVIHQENGGHGEGVNQGIRNATGLYYKVVDSDDWVNEDALKKVLDKLREFSKMEAPVDMVLCNYVYEYASGDKPRTVGYKNVFPVEKVFTFDEAKKFKKSQFIAMHTVIYRTQILKDIKLELPKHTFYVDNIYVYTPLPYIKSMYYMDVDLYRYFIGRADQSVNESVIMKRIDQHLKVAEIVYNAYNLREIEKTNKKLANYMTNFVSILMAITSIYLIKIGTKDALEKKKNLWDNLRAKDEKLYKDCRHKTEGMTGSNSKFVMGYCKFLYTILRKILKFN